MLISSNMQIKLESVNPACGILASDGRVAGETQAVGTLGFTLSHGERRPGWKALALTPEQH